MEGTIKIKEKERSEKNSRNNIRFRIIQVLRKGEKEAGGVGWAEGVLKRIFA